MDCSDTYESKMKRCGIVIALASLVLMAVSSASATQESVNTSNAAPDEQATDRTVVVGVKPAAPFVILDEDNSWSGISVELWEMIASDLGLSFEYQETDIDGLIDGVANNTFDIGVAALTATAEREARLDFTHPFYSTGLAIAVPADGGSTSSAVTPILRRLFSSAFFTSVLALAAILLIVGFVLWIFERKRNSEQFGGQPHQGLGNAFWWAAVTMTTVGYGDKAPITFGGRLIALVWMFASIIIISGFTAAIASALTVGQLGSGINGPDDLRGRTVATIADSTSEAWLARRGIARRTYDRVSAGLEAVRSGEVDAMVYDAPILKYLSMAEMQGSIYVLSGTFTRQDYGFGLPNDSPFREEINRSMLEQLEKPAWQSMLEKYLGE